MRTESIESRRYHVPACCNYLLFIPPVLKPQTLGVVALHGYGANPADMMRLAALAVGREHIIAALQGPYQHYLEQPGPDAKAGYNWGIRQHWQDSVALHHAMVSAVANELQSELGLAPERMVLLGFSQPVGLNYRFMGTSPDAFGGVIGICGGVPRDWEEDKYQAVTAPVLHIARDEDEFYPVEVVKGFPARLQAHADDVEFHLLPGKHRFPSTAAGIVRPWLQRKFAVA